MKLFFILLLLLTPFSYGEVRLIEVEIPEGKHLRLLNKILTRFYRDDLSEEIAKISREIFDGKLTNSFGYFKNNTGRSIFINFYISTVNKDQRLVVEVVDKVVGQNIVLKKHLTV